MDSTNILNSVLSYSSRYKEVVIGDNVDRLNNDELSNVVLRIPNPDYNGTTVTKKHVQAYLTKYGDFVIDNALISKRV